MKIYPLLSAAVMLCLLLGCEDVALEGSSTTECDQEVCAKRNILFYIGADTNGLDNGYNGNEPKQQIDEMRRGWTPGKGELLIYADQTNRRPCLMRINDIKQPDG